MRGVDKMALKKIFDTKMEKVTGKEMHNQEIYNLYWVWCQRSGADTIPRRLEPLPKL
jgi:hypothetical protein